MNQHSNTSEHRPGGRIVKAAWTTFLAACLVLAALMLVPAALGFERYVVTGGSMGGSHERGSLVFDDVVPSSSLEKGDVITFTPPGGDERVTHRIVAIEKNEHGQTGFRTKGDANEHRDPWLFVPGSDQAKVTFGVPYVGYAFAALTAKEIRMLVIGLPALLVALALVSGLWREAGEESRRRLAAQEATQQ